MDIASAWEWLSILLLIALVVAVIGLARKTLDRKGFALRLGAAVVVVIIVSFFADEADPVTMLPITVVQLLLFRWTAMRLVGVGMSRWWALFWLQLLPAGLALSLMLAIKGDDTDTPALATETGG